MYFVLRYSIKVNHKILRNPFLFLCILLFFKFSYVFFCFLTFVLYCFFQCKLSQTSFSTIIRPKSTNKSDLKEKIFGLTCILEKGHGFVTVNCAVTANLVSKDARDFKEKSHETARRDLLALRTYRAKRHSAPPPPPQPF